MYPIRLTKRHLKWIENCVSLFKSGSHKLLHSVRIKEEKVLRWQA